jgi:Pyridoxamine 5'-phosphate oxidase
LYQWISLPRKAFSLSITTACSRRGEKTEAPKCLLTPGLDDDGRVIISSRETAFKVKHLRRDPHASLCVFTAGFHGGGWVQINGVVEVISLPEAMASLVHLQRQIYGEHKSWSEFYQRMERERRLIIRILIESVGPLRRG